MFFVPLQSLFDPNYRFYSYGRGSTPLLLTGIVFQFGRKTRHSASMGNGWFGANGWIVLVLLRLCCFTLLFEVLLLAETEDRFL